MTKYAICAIVGCCALVMNKSAEASSTKVNNELWRDGVEIPVSSWIGKNVQSQDGKGRYYLRRGRAYFSPEGRIDVLPGSVAGIFFNFNYTNPDKYQNYQLSWRFPKNGWKYNQAAHFQLVRGANHNQQVFIPFSDIFTNNTLRSFQLALDGCANCKLHLLESKVVGLAELDNYIHYKPGKISYVNKTAPPKDVVFQRFKSKLLGDFPFFIAYFLIVLAVLIIGIWAIIQRGNGK